MSHDPQVKAAVLAALIAGQGVNEVAKEYKLGKATVSEWKSQIPELSEQIRTQKKRDFGEMLGAYLEKLLETAIKQQEHFQDPKWLMRQNAADMAVLHGVSIDKGVRLFEAAQAASMGPAIE